MEYKFQIKIANWDRFINLFSYFLDITTIDYEIVKLQ